MLIEITADGYDVELDLRYAAADNFTGSAVYGKARCYLHPEAVCLLEKAAIMARAQGLKLRLFDAYRPTEAQWKLWEHTPDPEFLADPRRGSPHSRGVAVDLTLVDRVGGKALDMGTGFDAFTPRSHHGNMEISAEAQRNRLLLMGLMTTAGWDFYRNEWWHYQLFNSRNYPLLSDAEAGTGLMHVAAA